MLIEHLLRFKHKIMTSKATNRRSASLPIICEWDCVNTPFYVRHSPPPEVAKCNCSCSMSNSVDYITLAISCWPTEGLSLNSIQIYTNLSLLWTALRVLFMTSCTESRHERIACQGCRLMGHNSCRCPYIIPAIQYQSSLLYFLHIMFNAYYIRL